MSYYFRDVKKFHDKFNLTIINEFTNLAPDLLKFRVKFLEEEYQEYVDSCISNDLPIAVDSLIDLVYITCGTAILHGISSTEWDKIIVDEDDLFTIGDSVFTADESFRETPSFLKPSTNVEFTQHLLTLIVQYMREATKGMSQDDLSKIHPDLQYTNSQPDPSEISRILGALYTSILAGATYMGISSTCWDEMWDSVQVANMSKERVKRPEDSKRGSVYDVIKPKGWCPPDSEGILAKYIA